MVFWKKKTKTSAQLACKLQVVLGVGDRVCARKRQPEKSPLAVIKGWKYVLAGQTMQNPVKTEKEHRNT